MQPLYWSAVSAIQWDTSIDLLCISSFTYYFEVFPQQQIFTKEKENLKLWVAMRLVQKVYARDEA